MKKIYLLIITLLSLPPLAHAQKELREGLPFKHTITIHKADGIYQIAELRAQKDAARADPKKVYYWYLRDSIQQTQGVYQGRLLHGNYQERYANRSLKVLGHYYKGLRHGEWRYLDPNGTLRRRSTWVYGEESGKYRLYNENGHLKEKGMLYQGKREGVVISYQAQDSVKRSYTRYKHNKATEGRVGWLGKIWAMIKF